MATHQNDARQLQQKMSELRGQITKESGRVADQTRLVLDWKYHVAANPWAAAAMAVAIGYWMVPKRTSSAKNESLAEMRAAIEKQTKLATPQSGMGKTLALAASSILLKTAANGALSRLMETFGSHANVMHSEYPAASGKNGPAVTGGSDHVT